MYEDSDDNASLSADEQYMLGEAYSSGPSQSQDYAKAVQWYLRAAERGHAKAQYRLSYLFETGRGVERDEAVAAGYLLNAAQQGDPDAQLCLGLDYLAGMGVERDEALAVAWFCRAAEQNDVRCQSLLGTMYCEGKGVPQDDALAVEWFRRAAEQGDVGAQYCLGTIYFEGRGVPQNDTLAVEWLRRAAEKGNADANYSLGCFYASGRGVPQDDVLAVECYRKAVDLFYAETQRFLCSFREQGYTEEQAIVIWSKVGRAKIYANAQNNLGWHYENGRGVLKDDAIAIEYYRRAAEQGCELAKTNLERLLSSPGRIAASIEDERDREQESDALGAGLWNPGVLVASRHGECFHRPRCKWMAYVNTKNLIEFSSHEDAVEAGYMPCKTCRS